MKNLNKVESKKNNRDAQILVLSAETEEELEHKTLELKNYLIGNPEIQMDDLAFTLQHYSQQNKHAYRRAWVSSIVPEAIEIMTTGNPKKLMTYFNGDRIKKRPVIFMLAGQGSQYINMCQELYQKEPIFRENLDTSLEILNTFKENGKKIKDILYPKENQDQAKERINQIEMAQLVIFIVEYALSQLLIKWGIKPDAMIGYSMGEYVAACISKVFTLEEALRLVVLRGKLVKETPRGALLSVPLTEDECKPLLNKDLSLSIVNGISCVVGGTPMAIKAFEGELMQKRIFPMPVNSTHAPHTHLMGSVLKEFREAVAKVPLKEPQIPYISNVTGNWITSQEATNPGYWARHLGQTVHFSRGLKTLTQKEDALYLEVGPGRDLGILAKRYLEKEPKERVIDLIRHPQRQVSDCYHLHSKVAQLRLHGIHTNSEIFFFEENRKKLDLPFL
jgi:acyl transferase domain-containing protein